MAEFAVCSVDFVEALGTRCCSVAVLQFSKCFPPYRKILLYLYIYLYIDIEFVFDFLVVVVLVLQHCNTVTRVFITYCY